MSVDQQLLEILCCPVTKTPVQIMSDEALAALNAKISQGAVKNADGKKIEDPLEEGLITEDGKTVYRVTNSIPVMIPGEGISMGNSS